MTGEVILHEYGVSPFSEKVRVCLGIKGLAWTSVRQPVIMPKPHLIPLTGGYRRIPVMQIGADIFCDSQLIVAELERRFPTPTLFPGGDAGMAQALQFWADRTFFQSAVGVIFGGMGDTVTPQFAKDREALSGRPFDVKAMKAAAPHMAEQLRAHLAFIEAQLADGRRFLTADAPGLADAAAYYNLWFVRVGHEPGVALFEAFPNVVRWEAAVRDIGHGQVTSGRREEALAIAQRSTPEPQGQVDPTEPNGLKAGERVFVAADDYGRDPVEGVLVGSSASRVAIRRPIEGGGEVNVHFPRAGFSVRREPIE